MFHSDSEITATPILDNPHLILLFYLTQLFLRELVRSYHLLKIIPMDMSGYFGKHEVAEEIGELNKLLVSIPPFAQSAPKMDQRSVQVI